jgi:hypothetical protein
MHKLSNLIIGPAMFKVEENGGILTAIVMPFVSNTIRSRCAMAKHISDNIATTGTATASSHFQGLLIVSEKFRMFLKLFRHFADLWSSSYLAKWLS